MHHFREATNPMNRRAAGTAPSKLRFAALLASLAIVAGCGHGGATTASSPLPPTGGNGGTGTSSVGSVTATFAFSFPKPTSSAARKSLGTRAPKYLSSATKSISLQVTDTKSAAAGNADIYANVPAALKAVQTVNFANLTGDPNTVGQCGTDPSNAGNYKCTAAFQMPIGIDATAIKSWDANGGTGNVLSAQVATLTTVQGVANSFGVSLDANANSIAITGSGNCAVGTVASGTTFGSVGTSPVTFNVAYTDPAGKTIVPPGLPLLQIEDNTSTYRSTSGTINGTGGTVSFTINQSTQSFTLTPSNSSVTNATVNIRGVPPNGVDGLSYSETTNFKFSTGIAAPSHNFLAVIEEANPGQINFFNVAANQSSLSTYTTAPTLAVTNSTNENKPDVNDPLSLAWDGNGDLLVGNSNSGSGNGGDLACIPAGAIATGIASSTTTSGDVTVPDGIAYDQSSGNVAVADGAPTGTDELSEFVLSGDYVESSHNLPTVAGTGAEGVVDVSPGTSLSAGTFAVAITDGGELDHAHGSGTTSEIVIYSPNGNSTTITSASSSSTYAIDIPEAIAWDQTHQQLLIANGSIWHKQMSVWNIGGSGNSPTFSLAKVVTIPSKQFFIGSWPDGHFAIEYNSPIGSGEELVQAYLNNAGTTAPTAIGGPIPYNSADTSTDACNGTGYLYGPNAGVESINWLSSTKLLIALSDSAPNASQNGLYIYDTSTLTVPAGYDDVNCATYAAAPTQDSFTVLSEEPAANGVAFLP
jgi:hypothetical protein